MIGERREMSPQRLAVLLERYASHIERPHVRRFVEKIAQEKRAGSQRHIPGWLFSAAMKEINECAVVGCSGKALYRVGQDGLCREHKGLSRAAIQTFRSALEDRWTAKEREGKRDETPDSFAGHAPYKKRPPRLRDPNGLDVEGLRNMLARRKRNAKG